MDELREYVEALGARLEDQHKRCKGETSMAACKVYGAYILHVTPIHRRLTEIVEACDAMEQTISKGQEG